MHRLAAVANVPEPVTDAHLAELDANYRPPPPLENWLDVSLSTAAWDAGVEALEARRAGTDEATFEEFRQRLVRQAAIDTGALEGLYDTERGFTRTVAAMAADWVAAVEQEKGVDVARLVEGQMAAYELALDLATGRSPVSEAVIRQLHELVCAGQETYDVVTPVGPQRHPLVKGSYKTQPNHVLQADGTEHSYAPVDRTADEMHRFVEQLRDPRFEAAHPALQAAFAHHSFVSIHPFSDGNGRVARVLSSIYLVRATSLPLVLYADERDRYLRAIRAADAGDVAMFAQFVADRATDTVLYLLEEFRAASQPGATAALRTLADALQGPGGLTHQEVDAVAERLRGVVREHLEQYVGHLELPAGVTAEIGSHHAAWPPNDAYRSAFRGNTGRPTLILSSSPPAQLQMEYSFEVLIHKDRHSEYPFRVVPVRDADGIDFRFDDVFPQPRTAAVLRLHAWLTRIVDRTLGQFATEVAEQLQSFGFRG